MNLICDSSQDFLHQGTEVLSQLTRENVLQLKKKFWSKLSSIKTVMAEPYFLMLLLLLMVIFRILFNPNSLTQTLTLTIHLNFFFIRSCHVTKSVFFTNNLPGNRFNPIPSVYMQETFI